MGTRRHSHLPAQIIFELQEIKEAASHFFLVYASSFMTEYRRGENRWSNNVMQ